MTDAVGTKARLDRRKLRLLSSAVLAGLTVLGTAIMLSFENDGILTARGGGSDTVAGLEGGADDYMAKPFRFGELLARIRLRMQSSAAGQGTAELSHRGLDLDVRTRRARIDGREVDLSGREFALAEELIRHAGQVLSREQLLSRVWGYDFDPGSNVVDVYVRYLRNKLGAERIETVRGMGYRLV